MKRLMAWPRVGESLSRRRALWFMVLVLLVAASLRLVALGEVPPGLYHDEAYNGLDALRVLEGDLSVYFSANNGREPLFIYLIAAWVGLLGRSPFAVRLAAFAPGLLTVAATYAAGRTLFSRRVGLLAAAVLSLTPWHFHLSRVGFRAVLLPLFIALVVWQAGLGWRSGRRRHWLAAGGLYGLSFYTYMAARFTPLALVLFGGYLVLSRPREDRRRSLAPLAWAALAALVVLAPLGLFTLAHPDLVLGRTSQVAIWNPEINGGDFWGTLGRNVLRTLGMVFVKGDRIWRHNVPWRPIFDPILALFFVVGLVVALRRFGREAAAALLIIWTAVMALPTLLAEDAPHFLRGVGVLPLITLFPALGMDWLLERANTLRRVRFAPRLSRFALSALLVLSLAGAANAYFGGYAHADAAGYWFEEGAVSLAGAINGFLDTGWDGARMRHGTPGGRTVYVEPVLWDTWTAVPFLVPASPVIQRLPVDQAWPAVESGPAAVFVWPYGDWQRVWPMLTGPGEISVREGVLSQGDRDPEPFTTYMAFYITPVEAFSPALARFDGGVELAGVAVARGDDGLVVRLQWHATAPLADDYIVFVHYLRDAQRVAQHDAQPAGGHYPTTRWKAGDLINDTHPISLGDAPDPGRDQLLVGLYRVSDGRHLELLDGAGNPAGQFVTLDVNTVGR
jgi:4-amino-4-deoxy-L-arabinose transferase-like glycosyltransferase